MSNISMFPLPFNLTQTVNFRLAFISSLFPEVLTYASVRDLRLTTRQSKPTK